MQSRTCMLSAFTLATATLLDVASLAADLQKEGTFTATYAAAGTYKATSVGKERFFASWDENGLSVGDGLIDHMTWHVRRLMLWDRWLGRLTEALAHLGWDVMRLAADASSGVVGLSDV